MIRHEMKLRGKSGGAGWTCGCGEGANTLDFRIAVEDAQLHLLEAIANCVEALSEHEAIS